MEIAKVGVRVGSRVEVRWEDGQGPFHATVVSCNDNDDLITVAYDDGDQNHTTQPLDRISLHPHFVQEWGFVTRICEAESDSVTTRTLHVTMLDPVFDESDDGLSAQYTGPALFEGMCIEKDWPPYAMSTRVMQVEDTDLNVVNAGMLFAFEPACAAHKKDLFFGIENVDAHVAAQEAATEASARQRRHIAARCLESQDHARRFAPEMDALRRSIATFQPSDAPLAELIVELERLGRPVGAHYLNRHLRCEGATDGSCCNWETGLSRYGRTKAPAGEQKIVRCIMDVDKPKLFQLRTYTCTNPDHRVASKRIDKLVAPKYDVRSQHIAATIIGVDSVTVSHGVHFISKSQNAVTAALMDWMMTQCSESANFSKIHRSLFDLWAQHRLQEFERWVKNHRVSIIDGLMIGELIVEHREHLRRCLPSAQQLGHIVLAVHNVIFKGLVAKLEAALAAVNGGHIGYDGGHTGSTTISVDMEAATTQLDAADVAASQAGSTRGERQPGVPRSRNRSYVSAIVLNGTGWNGGPITAGKIIPSESHPAIEKNLLEPVTASRARLLGAVHAAPAVVSTDSIRRDFKWLHAYMRNVAPQAYAKFGDFFLVVVADLPHATRLLTKPLPVVHVDYGTCAFCVQATTSRLLRPAEPPSYWDLVIIGMEPMHQWHAMAMMDSPGSSAKDSVSESMDAEYNIVNDNGARARLPCHDIVAVHIRRVLDGRSVTCVPSPVRELVESWIQSEAAEGLPWSRLMNTQRYDEILGMAAHAFGMSLAAVKKQVGPCSPPQLILQSFVRSWCQHDASKIPLCYSAPRQNFIDQLHLVKELANIFSWFDCQRSGTPERAQAAVQMLHELSDSSAAPASTRRGFDDGLIERVTSQDVGKLIGLRTCSAKDGVTSRNEALEAVRKLICPAGAKGGLVLRGMCNAAVVQRMPSHGTVAAEQTNMVDIRAADWAGRKEYGLVVAILEQKFLQTIRRNYASIRSEMLAAHLRHDKDKRLTVQMDNFESAMHDILDSGGRSSYAQYYEKLLSWEPVRETVESLQAKGFTVHSKGPYSARELELLREAVSDYDPHEIEDDEVLKWLAAKVGTRSAASVCVQLARMARANEISLAALPATCVPTEQTASAASEGDTIDESDPSTIDESDGAADQLSNDDDSGSEDEEQAAGLTSGASTSAEPEGDFDCGADSLFDSD